MREIKFRAYDKKEKRYANFNLSGSRITYIDKNTGECYLNQNSERYKDFVIVQYTGLKDKNGKEIYAGDILWNEYDECYGEVVFDDGEWKFEDITVMQSLYPLLDCVEVVGNIFENPELLGEG